MDVHKVKAPLLLKLAVTFFAAVFVLLTASFLYLQFFLGDEAAIPPFVRFLTEVMMGRNGALFFVAIPGIVVTCFIIWMIFAKAIRRERLLCELEQTVLEGTDIPMKSAPFQEVGIKGKFASQRHPALEEVVTQTVKSPIVAVQTANAANAIQPTGAAPRPLTPSYLNQEEVSTIRELKEQLAKEKLPTVSICRGGDLSGLSEEDKRQLEKIQAVDADRIFADIMQKNAAIIAQEPDKVKPFMEEKPAAAFLSADEIVTLHRKQQAQKKQQDKFVLQSKSEEDKTTDNIAKFYYESDLAGYDNGSKQ